VTWKMASLGQRRPISNMSQPEAISDGLIASMPIASVYNGMTDSARPSVTNCWCRLVRLPFQIIGQQKRTNQLAIFPEWRRRCV